MKSVFKRIITFILVALLITVFGVNVFAAPSINSTNNASQGTFETYTYWQEYGTDTKTAVLCKPMYKVKTVIDGTKLIGAPFDSITDIVSDENGNSYILDGEKSEIYVLSGNYEYKYTVSGVLKGGDTLKFKGAKGIYVKNEKIYIADTKNARVLVSDLFGNYLNNLKLPESKLIPTGFDYKPVKICVDSTNTIYVASDGSYYGALVYSKDEEFMGFYGANTVAATASDVIKTIFDRLFSNDIKKGSSVLALPYQMNDIVAGADDFIYTASSGKSKSAKGQVHILNPGGKDVLGKESYNFADMDVTSYEGQLQTESICGIDVDNDGFFYILDSRYGKVFWYDGECNMLCSFGGSLGPGEQEGTFSVANAIAINGSEVLVSDSSRKSVTVFTLTEYGSLVRKAQIMTLDDDYEGAEQYWKQIVKEDANSQLAYRGLSRAAFVKGENKKAMEYAKLGNDRETYSDAFKKAREGILSKAFIPAFIIIILLVAGLVWLSSYKRKNRIKFVKNEEVILLGRTVFHPFDAFAKLKEKKMGSVIIAVILLLLFYLISAISDVASGFSYNSFNAATYNSFFVFLRTIGLVILFAVSNWLVCVLLGGIGKLKEIFIVTCYSLIPLLFSMTLSVIFSNILVPDEFVFVSIFSTVCTVYTFFVLAVGIMRIHDYSFGKFLITTILTVIAMLIVVFLLFIIFMLSQQVYGWCVTVFNEITYG